MYSIGEYLDQMSGKKPRKISSIKSNIIRIADAIDAAFPEVADLLDQYLEEHADDIDNLPDIPAFSTIIKEPVVDTK